MSPRNEPEPVPPSGIGDDMGELTHDIVSLVELQFELFESDCRQGLKGLLIPVLLLLVAGILAVGTVPVGLLFIAEGLVHVAGLSRMAAMLIAALGGFILAVVLGVLGWSFLRGIGRIFKHSREEFSRNMVWIKKSLKRALPIEVEPPQDR